MNSDKWYFEVNGLCTKLAEQYDVPLIKVAGMMSALSPNVTFQNNVDSLEKFLATGGNCKVATFGKQKAKAQAIYDSSDNVTEDEVKDILGKGLKTRAFFENIYRPETSTAVTVDLWQVRWAKIQGIIPENGVLTTKRYKLISEAVIARAEELGIMPHQFQAITWVEIRGKAF